MRVVPILVTLLTVAIVGCSKYDEKIPSSPQKIEVNGETHELAFFLRLRPLSTNYTYAVAMDRRGNARFNSNLGPIGRPDSILVKSVHSDSIRIGLHWHDRFAAFNRDTTITPIEWKQQ